MNTKDSSTRGINPLKLLWGKIRRQILVRKYSKNIDGLLAKRKGECLQCANCCRILFRCPFLSKDNLCVIYTSPVRPSVCVHFPLSSTDLKDIKLFNKRPCGYTFET